MIRITNKININRTAYGIVDEVVMGKEKFSIPRSLDYLSLYDTINDIEMSIENSVEMKYGEK